LCKREVVEVTLMASFEAVAERDAWRMRLMTAEIVSSDASACDLNHSYSRLVSQTCTCRDRLPTARSPCRCFITRSAALTNEMIVPRMPN
jgi:hypothetical protein